MPRSPRSLVFLLAAMFALLAWASVAQAHRAAVVGPGDSIQAAVDAAAPGDTILVFGTHRENVAIQKDGLTLRGVGAVIRPPAVPAGHACFDTTVPGEAVHGICVVGDVDFDTGEITRYVDGATVSGFAVRGFAGFGVAATAASHTVFKANVTTDNRDAGLFSGQSLDTRIVANRASGGRFGVLVTGALRGTVAANSLHDNCVGALLVAASSNTIAGNLITGNVPSGDSDFSGGVVVAGLPGLLPSSDNLVKGNVILRNDPDILWDLGGTGNVFSRNLCRTSIPPGLCG
jgi:nitrous oxidase accessory protein NosD